MDLDHPRTLPSLDWSPSRFQILRGLTTARDFRVGRNLLVSGRLPRPRLLKWT